MKSETEPKKTWLHIQLVQQRLQSTHNKERSVVCSVMQRSCNTMLSELQALELRPRHHTTFYTPIVCPTTPPRFPWPNEKLIWNEFRSIKPVDHPAQWTDSRITRKWTQTSTHHLNIMSPTSDKQDTNVTSSDFRVNLLSATQKLSSSYHRGAHQMMNNCELVQEQ